MTRDALNKASQEAAEALSNAALELSGAGRLGMAATLARYEGEESSLAKNAAWHDALSGGTTLADYSEAVHEMILRTEEAASLASSAAAMRHEAMKSIAGAMVRAKEISEKEDRGGR